MFSYEVIPIAKLTRGAPDRFTYYASEDIPAGGITAQNVRNREVPGVVASRKEVAEGKAFFKKADFVLQPITKVLRRETAIASEYLELVEMVSRDMLWPAGGTLFRYLAGFLDADGGGANLPAFRAPLRQQEYRAVFTGETLPKNVGNAGNGILLCVASTRDAREALLREIRAPITPFEDYERLSREEAAETPRIVVGGTEALFFFYPRLDGIVLFRSSAFSWRESYRQPLADYRRIAEISARFYGCPVYYVDRYPTVGQYHDLGLRGAQLPPVRYAPLGFDTGALKQGTIISDSLAGELRAAHTAIVLVDRKGYGTLTVCPECGFVVQCSACEVPMVFDKRGNAFYCRHCDRTAAFPRCPSCGYASLAPFGFGIQRVTEEIRNLFPALRVASITKEDERIFKKLAWTDVDCLIGTDFVLRESLPRFDLSVIFSLESILLFPEFDAYEEVFQKFAFLNGKSDRLLVQTFHPERDFLSQIAEPHRYFAWELRERESLHLPPFVEQFVIEGDAPSGGALCKAADDLSRDRHLRVYGPVSLAGGALRLVVKTKRGYRSPVLFSLPPQLRVAAFTG